MNSLHLASNLSLPGEIAGQTVALVGIRGSGKTNTAGAIAEELLSLYQPVVVLDPTDAWWGLRSGYPVFIFGGPHGDLPLQETDGKVLAEFVVTEQVPLILSLRHLRKNAQRRFVTEFCEELYHLKGRDQYRSALTVFIDEAPLFIPQRVMGEVARTVGAVEDLISRGRNSGFGIVLISQRPATINKDVLSQADTIISHRLTSPQDRKALAEWIEENATIEEYKSVLSSLATLKTGQAWVWAPSLNIIRQVQIRKRKTFDSSAAPKLGQTVTPIKRLVEVDLEKLKGKLSASIEKAKADDPKLLGAKIADLESKIKVGQKLAEQKPPTIKEVPVLKGKQLAQLEAFCTKLKREAERHGAAMSLFWGNLNQLAESLLRAVKSVAETPRHDVSSRVMTPPPMRAPAQTSTKVLANSQDHNGVGSGGLRRMLIALAQRNGLSARQLGVRAGLSSTSGTFGTYLAKARTHGWIEGDASRLSITTAGLDALGEYEQLPAGSDLIAYWLNQLGHSGAGRMLAELTRAYPHSLTQEQLGQQVGMSHKSGTFGTYISKLRTLELIEGRQELKASAEFFA